MLSFATARKVDVSNKLARIVSGMSPELRVRLPARHRARPVATASPRRSSPSPQLFELPGHDPRRSSSNARPPALRPAGRDPLFRRDLITDRVIGAYDALLEGARDLLQRPRPYRRSHPLRHRGGTVGGGRHRRRHRRPV
ncbi:MAG: hypothetical protein MZW92_40740 [Comamonadaceae bacterium]|nr:hypothetical protein [Comamonadaceae bacterium]